jgi:hypothetical protein
MDGSYVHVWSVFFEVTIDRLWPLLISEDIQNVIQGLSLFTVLFDSFEEWEPEWLEKGALWRINEKGMILYPSQMEDIAHKQFIVLSLMAVYWYPQNTFPSSLHLQDELPMDGNQPIFPEYFEEVLSKFSISDEGSIEWDFQIWGSKVNSAFRNFRLQMLDTVLPQRSQDIEHIKIIKLPRYGLISLPKWILLCNNLQVLSLSHNKINVLPEELYSLLQLKELNIAGNRKLSQLSDSITKLQNLEVLLINSTSISEIPKMFGELQKLKHVNMGSTKIKKLPKSCERLDSLQYLSMNNCSQIEPDTLPKDLFSLTYFSASRVGWSMLPEAIFTWNQLEELNLSHNLISNYLPVVALGVSKIDLNGNPVDHNFMKALEALGIESI